MNISSINSFNKQAAFEGKIRVKNNGDVKIIDADDIREISKNYICLKGDCYLYTMYSRDVSKPNPFSLSDVLAAYNTAKANPNPTFVVDLCGR